MAALALCAAAAYADGLTVTVTPEGPNLYRIKLDTPMDAHIESVWALLTDYSHHADLLPYMIKSVIVSTAPLTVEQVGCIRILFWSFKMRIVQHVTESPPVEMQFQAVDGDFLKLEGRWTLVPLGNVTRLGCDFKVQPKRQVPTWAVRYAATHYLAKMVRTLQDRAEKL